MSEPTKEADRAASAPDTQARTVDEQATRLARRMPQVSVTQDTENKQIALSILLEVRHAAFDEAIAIARRATQQHAADCTNTVRAYKFGLLLISALEAARDATPTEGKQK